MTTWLGRRNDAAHGDYDSYIADDVRVMIEGIEGFSTRFPAWGARSSTESTVSALVESPLPLFVRR